MWAIVNIVYNCKNFMIGSFYGFTLCLQNAMLVKNQIFFTVFNISQEKIFGFTTLYHQCIVQT